MRTFKLTISYDGTDFSGFQRQSNARSVQAEMETALASIEGKHVTVTGAGRTDSGVHALGQVTSFQLERDIEDSGLLRALNAKLPEDVRVLSAEVAGADFSARFSARSKMYRYRISNTRVMSPFQRRFAWHVSRALDLQAMNNAARQLLGEHDFASFQGAPSRSERNKVTANADKDTTRTVTRSAWTEEPLAGGGRLLSYEVEGTGFLKYMVRALVGTLVEVGDGRRSPDLLRNVLESRDRGAAGPTAPPQGLYLVRVDYEAAAPVSF